MQKLLAALGVPAIAILGMFNVLYCIATFPIVNKRTFLVRVAVCVAVLCFNIASNLCHTPPTPGANDAK